VGSKTEIYKVLMNLARKEKIAIIILSEEIPEVLGICDRILVLEKGRIRGEFLRENANQELLHKVVNGL
jgi:ABC-type sugar transport system ATPase subunit